MHILFTTCGDCKYGTSRALLGLIKNLKKREPLCRISVVLSKWYQDRRFKEELEAIGCSVYAAPYMPFCQCVSSSGLRTLVKYPLMGLLYAYGGVFALGSLEKQLDLNTVDLIHINSSRVDFGGKIAEKYGKPLLWHIREFGDLDFRCYSYRPDYIQYMVRQAAVFVAVSDAVRKHWSRKGIPEDKIHLVYDGIESSSLEAEKVSALKDARRLNVGGCFSLIMVGAISEAKGQDQIIRALAMLPDPVRKKVTLDIVGDGLSGYVKRIRQLARRLGVDGQVRFLGYQKNFRIRPGQYDCGIICSRSEGFGRVTVEYLMADLPVIASDTGANPELIQDQRTGLLYHYPDTEDLKNKLLALMRSRKCYTGMRETAMKFTEEKNAEEIFRIYQALMEDRQPSGGQHEENNP